MFIDTFNSLLSPANATLNHALTASTPQYPFYHTDNTSVLPFMSDKVFSLIMPVAGYWACSLIFHALDVAQLPYFEKMRLHESEEVMARNKATVRQVIEAVILQQTIQTALGWVWFEDDETILKREVYLDHVAEMKSTGELVGKVLQLVLGERTALSAALALGGERLTGWVYWWGVPIFQMVFAL